MSHRKGNQRINKGRRGPLRWCQDFRSPWIMGHHYTAWSWEVTGLTFPFYVDHIGCCAENGPWGQEAGVGSGRPVRKLVPQFQRETVVAQNRGWQWSDKRHHHRPATKVVCPNSSCNCPTGRQEASHFSVPPLVTTTSHSVGIKTKFEVQLQGNHRENFLAIFKLPENFK